MCLADLFYNIATQKKKVGTLAPKRFITRLRKECGEFLACLYTICGPLPETVVSRSDDQGILF